MIGKKLRYLIETQGIKKAKLAETLDISPSRLSNYISGKREPDLAMLAEIARLLKVDANYFAGTEKVDYPVLEEIVHTDNGETVDIPVKRLNAKKRSRPSDFIKIDRMLIGADVSGILALEIPKDIIKPLLLKGDYLLVRPVSKHTPKQGDFIFVTGRAYSAYKVWIYKNEAFITDFDEKEIQKLSDLNDSAVYVVLLFMRVKR